MKKIKRLILCKRGERMLKMIRMIRIWVSMIAYCFDFDAIYKKDYLYKTRIYCNKAQILRTRYPRESKWLPNCLQLGTGCKKMLKMIRMIGIWVSMLSYHFRPISFFENDYPYKNKRYHKNAQILRTRYLRYSIWLLNYLELETGYINLKDFHRKSIYDLVIPDEK